MIKKLNALFHKHSRILFGAFTVLIIIAFTDFLTPGNISGCNGSGGVVGTAFGENVSAKELAEFGHKLVGRNNQLPEIAELFNAYCIVKRAEQLGIAVSDQEIANAISAQFAKDGKFDRAMYEQFLKNNQITGKDLAETFKIQLMMQKLSTMIANSVIVTDAEAENAYRLNNGVFTLKIAHFDNKKFSVAKADEAQLKEFYGKNKDRYITPGKFEALIVEVPFTMFKDAAAKAVSAADVKAVLDKKPLGYDGKPLSAEAVKEQLLTQKRSALANAHAGKIFGELQNAVKNLQGKDAQTKYFRNWAAKNKLTVSSGKADFNSRLIAGKYLPGICAALQQMPLNGNLLTNQENSNSGCSIAMLQNRTEPVQLTFAAAKAAVAKDRNAQKQLEAARQFAVNQAMALDKKDAKVKAAAFDKLPMATFSDMVFPNDKMMSDPNMIKFVYAIAPILPELATGDISKAVDTEDGAIIVKAVKRAPADMSKFAAQKEMIKLQLARVKQELAVSRFFEDINSQCGLINQGK